MMDATTRATVPKINSQFVPGWYIYSGDQVKYFKLQARMPMTGPFTTELDALVHLIPSAKTLREEHDQAQAAKVGEEASQLRVILIAIAQARAEEKTAISVDTPLFPVVRDSLVDAHYDVRIHEVEFHNHPNLTSTTISW
jgi:hypothetical protein